MLWVSLHYGDAGSVQASLCTSVLLLDMSLLFWVSVVGGTEVFGGTVFLHGMVWLGCAVVDRHYFHVLGIPLFSIVLVGVEGD